MYQDFKDLAQFYIVYISEAHATDDRRTTPVATELGIKEHVTLGERCSVAQRLIADKRLTIPCLVDNMNNEAAEAYNAHPDRLYVVRSDGRIGVAGERGPFGFKPALDEAGEWLASLKKTGKEPEIVARTHPESITEAVAEPISKPTSAEVRALSEICTAFADADSMTLELKVEEKGGLGRSRGPSRAMPIRGRYRKGHPVLLECNGKEAVRSQDQLVLRGDDGSWELIDSRRSRRDANRSRRRRSGSGSDDEGEDESGEQRQWRPRQGDAGADRTAATLQTTVLPHVALRDIHTKLKGVRLKENGKTTIYDVDLNAAGAQVFHGGGFGRGGRGGRGAQRRMGPKFSGHLTLRVNGKGEIETIEVETSMTLEFGERTIDRSKKTSIRISDINKTKFEIPKKALERLENAER